MAWTYSGNPATSDRDQVRFLCGDTDPAYAYISDEEIDFLLTMYPSPRTAAQNACMSIIGKLAKEVDYTIGPEQVKASQRFEQYKDMLATLREQLIGINAAPSADIPCEPIFDVGMFDNRGCE